MATMSVTSLTNPRCQQLASCSGRPLQSHVRIAASLHSPYNTRTLAPVTSTLCQSSNAQSLMAGATYSLASRTQNTRSTRCSLSALGTGSGPAQLDVGVVIVDHGSRKKDSNEMLVEFGKVYQEVTGCHVVEIAHMEIAEPTIEQAVDKCVNRGASTVVIAPYFLSKGRHIQDDIPALVKEAQAKYPGVKCIIADPIGVDPLMAQLIANRVQSAIAVKTEAVQAV